jgi:hypothetical protein
LQKYFVLPKELLNNERLRQQTAITKEALGGSGRSGGFAWSAVLGHQLWLGAQVCQDR